MYADMLMFSLQHSPSVSTPVGLPGAVLRPGVEVLLGVGASDRDVGVLDLDTGVVDFSFYNMKSKAIIVTESLNTSLKEGFSLQLTPYL